MHLPRAKPLTLSLGALALLGLAAAPSARASTNIVADSGFEAPDVSGLNSSPGGTNYAYQPTGSSWTFSQNSGIIRPSSAFDNGGVSPAGYGGAQYAFIQSASGKQGSFDQSLSLVSGTTYDYSFLAAGRNAVSGTTLYGGNTTDTLSLGGTVLDTFTTVSGQAFTPITGSFVYTSGSTALTFTNTTPLGGDETAFIDNVNVSPAPEPSQVGMLALMGLGLGGLIFKARRRTRAA